MNDSVVVDFLAVIVVVFIFSRVVEVVVGASVVGASVVVELGKFVVVLSVVLVVVDFFTVVFIVSGTKLVLLETDDFAVEYSMVG